MFAKALPRGDFYFCASVICFEFVFSRRIFFSCTLKTGIPVEEGDCILKLLRRVSHPEIQLGVVYFSSQEQIAYFLTQEAVYILIHFKFLRVWREGRFSINNRTGNKKFIWNALTQLPVQKCPC